MHATRPAAPGGAICALLDLPGLDALVRRLSDAGWLVLGPSVSDGVIDWAPIADHHDLPVGWHDEQEPGRYRLTRGDDVAVFGYAVGPRSPKSVLYPSRRMLWSWNRSPVPAAGPGPAGPGPAALPAGETLPPSAVPGPAAPGRPSDPVEWIDAASDRAELGGQAPGPTAPGPTAPGPGAGTDPVGGGGRAGPIALLGVRPCELAAIAVQDRVLLGGVARDTGYAARRKGAFLVAVNCTRPASTCFCASLGTGPAVPDPPAPADGSSLVHRNPSAHEGSDSSPGPLRQPPSDPPSDPPVDPGSGPAVVPGPVAGYDLVLTELTDGGRHEFAVAVGSERGAALLASVPHRIATEDDRAAVDTVVARAASRIRRSVDPTGLPDLLAANLENPRWDEVADRCLSCANCTMSCPTCFCVTVDDVTDLRGVRAERWQRWDSCFGLDFSHLHGVGPVRASTRARYRQWLTHKFGTWQAQFGTPGCVGCGRCITWCPAGIDLTEEVAAVRATDRRDHSLEDQ